MNCKRFDVFYEKHIGFGIRWDMNYCYRFMLSVSIMCVTVNIGIGSEI